MIEEYKQKVNDYLAAVNENDFEIAEKLKIEIMEMTDHMTRELKIKI